jgi:hypothetical protein
MNKTNHLPQWRKSGAPKQGQALTDIGKPVRSINRPPGYPTGPLPGSHKLPTKTKRVGPAPPPVITIQKTPVDTRYFVADGESLPEHFGAYLPGIDPSTGRPWSER